MQDDISHHRRRYTLPELKQKTYGRRFDDGARKLRERTFFVPILIGRVLMRLTGWRPASENNITIGALNGLLGRILGAESWWLQHAEFPVRLDHLRGQKI